MYTMSDFDSYDWQSVIAGSEEKSCDNYHELFGKKANELKDAGDAKGHQVFALLQQLALLLMRLDRSDQPFHPALFFGVDKRSMVIEDLDDATLETLKTLTPEIRDPEMQARVADIVWVVKQDFRTAA